MDDERNSAGVPETVRDVLDYWIGDADFDVAEAARRQSLWFGNDPEVDAEIERRFGGAVEDAAGDGSTWPASARATLARIIVLDQFTRNLYRNTARAFAFDDKALELSLELQREGGLGALGWIGRVFVLMPMQHAEDLEVQERSVRLFEELARRCLTAHREMLEDNAKYARLHRDIVARFGRFPHRNKTLGRASTTAELEWLASGAPTFGQGG